MAFSTIPNSVVPQKWLNTFIKDYQRGNYYSPFMKRDSTGAIMKIDGLGRAMGDTVNIPHVASTAFAGAEDCAILEGNEPAAFFGNDVVKLKLVRDARVLQECTTWKTPLDLFDAVRNTIKQAFIRKLNNDINEQLKGVVVAGSGTGVDRAADTVIKYADANATQRNAYLVANTDRIVAGKNSTANKTSGVFATMINALTVADDRMTADLLMKAVRMAEQTDAAAAGDAQGAKLTIAPLTYDEDNGEEGYVFFCTSRQFRDLQNDPVIYNANKDAGPRNDNNRIFTGESLLYSGVLIKKVPTLTALAVNASSVQIDAGFLCGQAAVAVAWAMSPTPIMNDADYGSSKGVGLKEVRGVKKISYYGRQNGVVTVLTASPNDA